MHLLCQATQMHCHATSAIMASYVIISQALAGHTPTEGLASCCYPTLTNAGRQCQTLARHPGSSAMQNSCVC